MTLFLSRLRLSQSPSVQALDKLLNPDGQGPRLDAHHRLIWSAFAETADQTRDFLWREDEKGVFFALSKRRPVAGDLLDAEVKPFAPNLSTGDRLEFVLRANATRDRKGAGRVDVVMDALRDVPKGERAAQRMDVAQREGATWFARQGEAAGFRTLQVVVGDYSVAVLPGYNGKRKGQPQFGILEMSGVLEVTDPALFLAKLASGFGRARAFGCGLMLIRRVG